MPKSPPSHSQEMAKKRGRINYKRMDSKRESSVKRGYGGNWPKLKLNYLSNNPTCEECKRNGRDAVAASMVDHIIPLKKGGTHDPENLQSLCDPCHTKKTMNEDALPKSNITIIAGPPGSGKTTLAEKNFVKGFDIIIDHDRIYSAISMLPMYEKPVEMYDYVRSAIEGLYYRLEHPKPRKKPIRHAWIVAGLPKKSEREELVKRFNANLVILEKSVNDCIYQVQQGNMPERANRVKVYATKWWENYER